MVMAVEDRLRWVLDWLQQRPRERVDVLSTEFVEDYAEATGVQVALQFFGAPKCRQLGRDLGILYKRGYLHRVATGLPPGDASMGFPKWVFSYRLKPRFINSLETPT